MSRLKWLWVIFLRYYRHLGLRVCLYAGLSLLSALLGPLVPQFLSDHVTSLLDQSSVMPVLTIMASSMLAVSTFSLNIMVTSHHAAAQSTTPRVHRLLLENTTTQSVLATFIGAFVYSLASIILFQVGFYADEAAVVVMAVTIAVGMLVVLSMLRWIQHLTDLGSVDDSLATVTQRAREVLTAFSENPALGGKALAQAPRLPADATPVRAPTSGHLQLVDALRLQECLPEGVQLVLDCRPGKHVLKGQVMGRLSRDVEQDCMQAMVRAFTIGTHRSFEQDVEFGLIVLAEIASKALSPGINDPGTAIASVSNLKTLLWRYCTQETEASEPSAPDVFIPVPDYANLFDAAFSPIARDGAAVIEVATHLRAALYELAQSGNQGAADAARQTAQLALDHARRADLLDRDMDRLLAYDP